MKTVATSIFNLGGFNKNRRTTKKYVFFGVLAALCIGQGLYLVKDGALKDPNEGVSLWDSAMSPVTAFDNVYRTNTKIYDEMRRGESLYSALRRLNVQSFIAERYIKSLSNTVNLKNLKVGTKIMVEQKTMDSSLGNIALKDSVGDVIPQGLELFLTDEQGLRYSVRAELLTHIEEEPTVNVSISRPPVTKELSLISGEVSGSLYSSIVAMGGDAQLVNNFSDIFSWQIDFFRETRSGDRFQIVAERNFSEGRFVGFGSVKAAQYVRSGGKVLRGYYFKSKDGGVSGYFDEKGLSLKSAFLKAPLKLANISSRFNPKRMHPVLGYNRPHNGVDYAANKGTPFMAVAGGTVINAGYSPFNGNWVRIQHANGYQTEYLHATKLAKGVRVGARVQQGQVIGYVGKTGLASGYHLHFGMKKNLAYVDPIKQKFNNSPGISDKYVKEFKDAVSPLVLAFNMQLSNKEGQLAEISRLN